MRNKNWIPTNPLLPGACLPPEGKYVLVHLTNDNWGDNDDPQGVYFKVAKMVKGISKEERKLMRMGLADNPRHYFVGGSSLRSEVVTVGDEDGNNLVPFCWKDFGPGRYWGQEVDYWMAIPSL